MSRDDATSCSVLLIDDDSIAEEIVAHCLANCAGAVTCYDSRPARAVELAVEVNATVVLVNLRMPVLDGFDVVRLLRADPATEHIPIIVLSSEDHPELRARAFAAGANDYLMKWPDGRELAARVRYHSAAYLARRQRDEALVSLRRSREELAASQLALHQAQKMEAIGQLAGGVAHDFNNVLQLISGNLQLIKLLGGISENVAKRVDIALAGIERGAKLSAHLLAFARSQPLQASVVNPAEVLLDMEHMLRRVLGPRATIMTDIEDGLWSIRVDPSQLTNVILNLAINARDAMLEGGTLTIRAANVPKTSPRLSNLACSDYVMIEVADTGCGMPAAVRERAFESFFTTKPTGQGSGLGLSMASGFIQQSGGEIVIDSKPGHGTSVRIFLRRSEAESETEAGATVGFKAVLLPSGL